MIYKCYFIILKMRGDSSEILRNYIRSYIEKYYCHVEIKVLNDFRL